MTADEQCVWIPIVTTRGRVSTMFHRTDCGQTGAPVIDKKDSWKYCPYCGKSLLIASDPFRLRTAS